MPLPALASLAILALTLGLPADWAPLGKHRPMRQDACLCYPRKMFRSTAFRFHLLSKARNAVRWLGVLLSLTSVLFATLSYIGFWSYIRGDDLLDELANRLDTSYAVNISRQVRPNDPEWSPLIRVIKIYSNARGELLKDREPLVFARMQAVTSAQSGGAEWTAPSTPILLLYKEWPAPGSASLKPGQDAFTVGTLGTLHEWIKTDKDQFDFFWRTLIFGFLSACVGAFLAMPSNNRATV